MRVGIIPAPWGVRNFFIIFLCTKSYLREKARFEGIPSGNCAIKIKYENYKLVSETFTLNYSSAKIFYLHLSPLNAGVAEQIVSPINSTYAKDDRLTDQLAIPHLCGFTAFHGHVSRI